MFRKGEVFTAKGRVLSRWLSGLDARRHINTTAIDQKGLGAILPMPLEDTAIAPLPPELAEQHLRDRYMLAGYGLARIREEAG
jgi:hypothetical protein